MKLIKEEIILVVTFDRLLDYQKKLDEKWKLK